jgi:hypothetical protein
MECKELEAVLAEEGLSPLPPEAYDHLTVCPACQDLIADLSAIVGAAQRIPAEVNPPDRIWVALRSQLEAEGIIREPQMVGSTAAGSWWSSLALMFRPRALATVAATLFLVAGSVYLVQRPGMRTNKTVTNSSASQTQSANTAKSVLPAPSQQAPVTPPKIQAPPVRSARTAVPPQPRESRTELMPSPSENAYFGDSAAVLSQTEDALPTRELANNTAVDASLRQNLRTLNEFIAECEARLKQYPQDQLTREYLNMAYQQKAELLTAMMDSGRSEH